ncbi:MAG: hypothetical protein Q8903_08625, partial [Bacteroidota bacterium]|nr:hypothetical protein [Bacteroidota bacterium]
MKAMIESKDLKRIIKATGKFISKNDMRPILQYIRLDFEQKSVVATACDGCRISTITVPCKSDEKFTAFIEPYLMPHMPKCDVLIEMVDNNCFINVEGRIVGYRQPESNLKYDIRKVTDDFSKLK